MNYPGGYSDQTRTVHSRTEPVSSKTLGVLALAVAASRGVVHRLATRPDTSSVHDHQYVSNLGGFRKERIRTSLSAICI